MLYSIYFQSVDMRYLRIQYNIQNIMSGKRQRPSHFQIDQKTLQYKESPEDVNQGEKDSPEKIRQRKFYKIKGPLQSNNEVSQSKANFTLFENLPIIQRKPQNDNQSSRHEQNNQKTTKKDNVEPLFGNKQPQKKQQVNEQPKSLFGKSLSNTSNIFTNISLFGNGNGIGLFTNNGNGQKLFSNNNIFAKKDPIPPSSETKPDVSKPPNSIFGTPQSIFSFNTNGIPPVKKQSSGQRAQGDEEGDGDSAQLQNEQKKQIDPSKSTGTYQYSSECQVLFQNKLIKFKKGEGEVVENTEIVVQQDSQKKITWVIVRLVATKNPILTGLLIKGKSSVKQMGSKQENVVLSVIGIKDKKHEPCALKLQFQKAEQGRKFIEVIEKLIK